MNLVQRVVYRLAVSQAKKSIKVAYKAGRLVFSNGNVRYTDKNGTVKIHSYNNLAKYYYKELDRQWLAKTGHSIETDTGLSVADVEKEIKKLGGIK